MSGSITPHFQLLSEQHQSETNNKPNQASKQEKSVGPRCKGSIYIILNRFHVAIIESLHKIEANIQCLIAKVVVTGGREY